MADPQKLILYSRHACHLCEVMQAELQTRVDAGEIELELRDVDAQADWRRDYGVRVPLLMSGKAEILSEYHLDETRLDAWLEKS